MNSIIKTQFKTTPFRRSKRISFYISANSLHHFMSLLYILAYLPQKAEAEAMNTELFGRSESLGH